MKALFFHRLFILVATLSATINVLAQGTIFTYHGRLANSGSPANGNYDLSFSVFDAETGANQVGNSITNTAVLVADGLFMADLNFGTGVFTGPERWLEIAVRTNGVGDFTILNPRRLLTPTPYAIMANTASNLLGTLSASQLTGTADINISGNALTASSASTATTAASAATFTGPLAGDVTGLQGATVVAAVGGQSAANVASGAGAANAATEINTPNTIVKRDGSGNFAAGAITAETISGEGSGLTGLNATELLSGTVSDARLSTNVAFLNADQIFSGSNIFSGVVQLTNTANILAGTFTGDMNFLGATDDQAVEFKFNGQRMLRLEPTLGSPNVIGGDLSNYTFSGPSVGGGTVGSTIGGGSSNSVGSGYSTIAGGTDNSVGWLSFGGSIGGGQDNHISIRSGYCTIGGGYGNGLFPDGSSGATISGGINNSVNAIGGAGTTIGGGVNNSIIAESYAMIGGGYSNRIGVSYSVHFGGSSATIVGGFNNLVVGDVAAIGGGAWNAIGTAATLSHSAGAAGTIAGGLGNNVNGIYNTVGGGSSNTVADIVESATISGGSYNTVGGTNSSIGGGAWNVVQGRSSTIAGGQSNQIGGAFSFIPGGFQNSVTGDFSLAAGRRGNALHSGTFVWADSQAAAFTSTANNQFLIRASGGVGIGNTDPIAQLDVRGQASLGNAFMPVPINASNVLNLQVGATTNGWHNGIGFLEDTNGTGMKLGYDGTLLDDDNKLVIYDINNQLRFVFESGGNLGLGVANPSNPIQHTSGALLTAAGVWQNASDVNRKTDFAAIEPQEVLKKLVNLKVTRWRYRTEAETVRHIGPMAQDFKAAFGLGEYEKSIGTVDADGVALAAIQGLNEIVQEQQAELKQKEAEIQSLQQRLEALERAVLGPEIAQRGGGR